MDELGNVTISTEVIATIASVAAGEIEGVSKMEMNFAESISEKFGKKSYSKGVKVQIEDDTVIIDVFINIIFGYPINETAVKVQENIKKSVESMTEFKVKKIDVHISGVTTIVEEEL